MRRKESLINWAQTKGLASYIVDYAELRGISLTSLNKEQEEELLQWSLVLLKADILREKEIKRIQDE